MGRRAHVWLLVDAYSRTEVAQLNCTEETTSKEPRVKKGAARREPYRKMTWSFCLTSFVIRKQLRPVLYKAQLIILQLNLALPSKKSKAQSSSSPIRTWRRKQILHRLHLHPAILNHHQHHIHHLLQFNNHHGRSMSLL